MVSRKMFVHEVPNIHQSFLSMFLSPLYKTRRDDDINSLQRAELTEDVVQV